MPASPGVQAKMQRKVPTLLMMLAVASVTLTVAACSPTREPPSGEPSPSGRGRLVWILAHGSVARSTDGGATWSTWTPDESVTLRSISFADDRRGWLTGGVPRPRSRRVRHSWGPGDHAVFLRSSDGGATWGYAGKDESGGSFQQVSFPETSSGWGLRRTGIGGSLVSMSRLSFPPAASASSLRGERVFPVRGGWAYQGAPPAPAKIMFFLDKNHGWVVSKDLFTWRTTNGGRIWQRFIAARNTRGEVDEVTGVTFIDPRHGWVCGRFRMGSRRQFVARTSDAGTLWDVRVVRDAPYLWDVDFADTSNGWAVGRSGAIFATTDGGLTWSKQGDLPEAANLHDVDAAGPGEAWAVGLESFPRGRVRTRVAGGGIVLKPVYRLEGIVLHTTDGGRTWSKVPVPLRGTGDRDLPQAIVVR